MCVPSSWLLYMLLGGGVLGTGHVGLARCWCSPEWPRLLYICRRLGEGGKELIADPVGIESFAGAAVIHCGVPDRRRCRSKPLHLLSHRGCLLLCPSEIRSEFVGLVVVAVSISYRRFQVSG